MKIAKTADIIMLMNNMTNTIQVRKNLELLDALNRIDEFACYATEDNDNGEAQQLAKDYNLLFNFISKQK